MNSFIYKVSILIFYTVELNTDFENIQNKIEYLPYMQDLIMDIRTPYSKYRNGCMPFSRIAVTFIKNLRRMICLW